MFAFPLRPYLIYQIDLILSERYVLRFACLHTVITSKRKKRKKKKLVYAACLARRPSPRSFVWCRKLKCDPVDYELNLPNFLYFWTETEPKDLTNLRRMALFLGNSQESAKKQVTNVTLKIPILHRGNLYEKNLSLLT